MSKYNKNKTYYAIIKDIVTPVKFVETRKRKNESGLFMYEEVYDVFTYEDHITNHEIVLGSSDVFQEKSTAITKAELISLQNEQYRSNLKKNGLMVGLNTEYGVGKSLQVDDNEKELVEKCAEGGGCGEVNTEGNDVPWEGIVILLLTGLVLGVSITNIIYLA